MDRIRIAAPLLLAAGLAACAHTGGAGWETLIDGERGLDNFNRVGDANWRAEGGAIVADRGKGGHLVSKRSYTDFELRAEFWAETDTNSGVYLRCASSEKIGTATCYEVNIWDIRPELRFGTGAIVDVVAVPVPLQHKAGGRWNTFEITARGGAGPSDRVAPRGGPAAPIRAAGAGPRARSGPARSPAARRPPTARRNRARRAVPRCAASPRTWTRRARRR